MDNASRGERAIVPMPMPLVYSRRERTTHITEGTRMIPLDLLLAATDGAALTQGARTS